MINLRLFNQRNDLEPMKPNQSPEPTPMGFEELFENARLRALILTSGGSALVVRHPTMKSACYILRGFYFHYCPFVAPLAYSHESWILCLNVGVHFGFETHMSAGYVA